MNKDDSEKDSDSPESPPDSMETQEVVLARENLVSLMAEQKRIRKQKASLPVECFHLSLLGPGDLKSSFIYIFSQQSISIPKYLSK